MMAVVAAPTTALESVLRRERRLVLLAVIAASVPAWLFLVPAALDMYGGMTGPAAWMMRPTWDLRYALLIFLMWALMMVGMMLPSAAPTILAFAQIARRSANPQAPVLRSYAFAGGYLLAWTAFSVVATVLQWLLSGAKLLSPMMEAATPVFAATILILAGIYQATPLKNGCLVRCRSPLAYLAMHWRPGMLGALRMGFAHGLTCIGCCSALMLLLFAGGVMSLTVIVALTFFVLIEKVAPYGAVVARASGLILIVAGLRLLLTA